MSVRSGREGPWSEWAVPGSASGCAWTPNWAQGQAPILFPKGDIGEVEAEDVREAKWVTAWHQGHCGQQPALRESCGYVETPCPGVMSRIRVTLGGQGWGPRVSNGGGAVEGITVLLGV